MFGIFAPRTSRHLKKIILFAKKGLTIQDVLFIICHQVTILCLQLDGPDQTQKVGISQELYEKSKIVYDSLALVD